MFNNKKIEKVEKISTDAFGNSKYKVTERTGWFSTKTYEVSEKSNSNSAGAGIILIGLIFLIAIAAIAVLPFIMVLIANSPGSINRQSKYRWISFASLIVIVTLIAYTLNQPTLYKQFSALTKNPWLMSLFIGLNVTALFSLILAQLSFVTNRANQFFCIFGGIVLILIAFQMLLSQSAFLTFSKYNEKQMEAACECYHNS